jgi:glycine cleavage system H lipoate-binding protein
MNWAELKYKIADKLFEKEMDEAYEMGVREGATHTLRELAFSLKLGEQDAKLTKAQATGYQKAVQRYTDTRAAIKKTFELPFL